MRKCLTLISLIMMIGCGVSSPVPQETTDTSTNTDNKTEKNKSAKLVDPDCVDPDLTKLLVGIKMMKCDGSMVEGQMPLPLAQNIKSGVVVAGVTGTLIEGSQLSDLENVIPGNIKNGVIIAGVSGTLVPETHEDCTGLAQTDCIATAAYPTGYSIGTTLSDCNSNGQIGCATTSTYRSADISNLIAANIKEGITIAGVTGNVVQEQHANCTGNKQTGCIATTTYQSADLSSLNENVIKSGVTVAGTTGNLIQESHTNCTDNNQQGCITTASYRSASFSNLTSANIKSGVIIAGVSGIYPSSTALIEGASSVADLDTATFDAKIKSTTDFEWFDAAGNRYQRGGAATIIAGNIKSGVTVFGVTGTIDTTAPDPWDVRKGVVIGSITGLVNMKCRERDGAAPAGDQCWGESYQDITHNGQSTCASYPADCKIKDRISGLLWAKSGGQKTWVNANTYCANLVVDGTSGWRLAEKEELQRAYIQGLANGTGIVADGNVGYWSYLAGSTGHWMVRMVDTGLTFDSASTGSLGTLCVK